MVPTKTRYICSGLGKGRKNKNQDHKIIMSSELWQKSNLQLSITKQNRKVTEGKGLITVQSSSDSPPDRKIWEAAMTGFTKLV